MEKIAFHATHYPSDLTDAQWAQVEMYFPQGVNSRYHKRSLIDAVLYLAANRCEWKALPHDFPPYPAVHTFYRRACAGGLWEKVLNAIRQNPGSTRKKRLPYGQ